MATQTVAPFATNPATDALGNPKVTAASPWPNAAGYDASVGSGQTAQATSTSYAPATTPTATKWDVTEDQTVAGQVKGLIAANSPLQQQAETRSLQQVNQRGLLNSSLAVGAGQSALYDAALPIATADAAAFGRSAGYNADTTNKFNAAAYDAENQSKAYTADSANKTSQFNTETQNRQLQADQTSINQASQYGAEATNKALLSSLDANTRVQLSDIEANYKVLMQSSASAADLQKQTFTNITNISSSTTMDQAAKDAATANQIAMLKTGLGVIGGIGNLDLGPLLTF